MNILALDTASPEPGVCAARRADSLRGSSPGGPARLRRTCSPRSPAASQRAGLALAECDRIAVCSGPGSFTGLRVGLATAWGLGRALEIPVESGLDARGAGGGRPRRRRPTASPRFSTPGAARSSSSLSLWKAPERARCRVPAARLPRGSARAATGPFVCSPGGSCSVLAAVLRATSVSPGRSPSRWPRAPRDGVAAGDSLRAIYSRPSAAEEKRGAP